LTPRFYFGDATILCGALCVDGVNRKILKAVRFSQMVLQYGAERKVDGYQRFEDSGKWIIPMTRLI